MSSIYIIMGSDFFLLAGVAGVCAVIGTSWTLSLWAQRRFVNRAELLQYRAHLLVLSLVTLIAIIVGFLIPLGVSLAYLAELISGQ